jgi:hypothetical protein
MPGDDVESAAPDERGVEPTLVAGYAIHELVGSSGGVDVYRARDERVGRDVVLRVAGEARAATLLEDARRIATVSHPGLVVVLAAGLSETGAYAAIQDVAARPLSECGSLSSAQGARVAADVAGVIEALCEEGLRAVIDPTTVLVAGTGAEVTGLVDPLRATSPGRSCLSAADPVASTSELAELIARAVPTPDAELRRAIDTVRSGASSGPREFARMHAPPRLPRAGRRVSARILAAACVALAALVAAFVVHERSGGTKRTAAPRPVARIVARIPLGLTRGETPVSTAILGRDVWIATSTGRLLEADPAVDQVVGNAILLGKQHAPWALVASDGSLYTSDQGGWLLRIDPRTRSVTGRRHFTSNLTAMKATGGVLWIASFRGDAGSVMRVDPRTLRPLGDPIHAPPFPLGMEARGGRAWMYGLEGMSIVRVDTSAGTPRTAHVGPQTSSTALDGGTLWIADRFDGTVSALDADRMTFRRPALLVSRSARGVLAEGPDLWVTASAHLSSGPLRLERFDARSGQRVGRAVIVGAEGGDLDFGLGSLWVLTDGTLTRLSPTTPRPALHPVRLLGPSPRALTPGPLAAGDWRTTAFSPRFTFSTHAYDWRSSFEEPDYVELVATGEPTADVEIAAPSQVFARDGVQLRPVGTPANLLEILRRNPRLRIGAVHRVSVGGRPALQFDLRTRRAVLHPEVCGPHPCVLLFPVDEATLGPSASDDLHLSLLRSAGRTVVISEKGDSTGLAASTSLLGTVRFAA